MAEEFHTRWTPQVSNKVQSEYNDTLWIYDGGDLQGFFLEKVGDWWLLQIVSREYDTQGHIQEKGYRVSDDKIPQHFFSKESYPVFVKKQSGHVTFQFAGWSVILTLMPSALQHPQQPQLPLPDLPPYPEQNLPSSHPPRKSVSRQPTQRQPIPQSKNKAEPKTTSSPSSNQVSHGQQRQPAPARQVKHSQQHGAAAHNVRKSKKFLTPSSQSQPSLSSPPPLSQG